MKVGDRLVCKTSFGMHRVIKGDFVIISDIISHKGFNTLIRVYNYTSTGSWAFYLERKSMNCVWNYFYTPQEIRKMKLKKIDESR